ncbi:lipase 1 [Anabrus simplex]|uniref:lipase 1 n=1 Tax=Anabrus simplex TaxID=316456 RepID=UPI0035A33030
MIQGAALYILMRMMMGVYGYTGIEKAILKARKLAPELFMKAPERATKDGYKMETHSVQTDDGYILGVHRIPGIKTSPPILFQHGLGTASDSWIVFGRERSLAYQLADNGYDVWMGNARGNLYSKNHTTMKPTDPQFWKFSWHEMGIYDMPATIDYILTTTGHTKLFCVVYSMGNTMTYVLLSMRPEYNSKMRLVISLSPAIFFKHTTSPSTLAVVKNWNLIKRYLDSRPTYEMFPYSDEMNAMYFYLCQNRKNVQKMFENVLFDSFGESRGLNRSELPLIGATLSGGHSLYTVWHFIQLIQSGRFQQFDYGEKLNEQIYGSSKPPEYNLKMLTAPVAMHYGASDSLISSKDIQNLSTILPNVVEARQVPTEYFNHLDFIMHPRIKELLNDHIMKALEKY